MVASSNATGPNIDTYYYSIISLRSMRTVVLLSELNNIETCTSDISRLVPAQDGPFFYTRSHLSALQNCALLFSTNF